MNVGKNGVRGTVGIPGSGLSYSDMLVDGDAHDIKTNEPQHDG